MVAAPVSKEYCPKLGPEGQEGLYKEDNLGVLSESTQEFLERGDFDVIAGTFETLLIVIRDFLKAC